MCVLAGDEKINMDKLENMSKNYPFTKAQTTVERTPGLDTALANAIKETPKTPKKHWSFDKCIQRVGNFLGLR